MFKKRIEKLKKKPNNGKEQGYKTTLIYIIRCKR